MIAQCLGGICGCALVKAFQRSYYERYGSGANQVAQGYTKGAALGAEIVGTFILVYTVFSATDPDRVICNVKNPDSQTKHPAIPLSTMHNQKLHTYFLFIFKFKTFSQKI